MAPPPHLARMSKSDKIRERKTIIEWCEARIRDGWDDKKIIEEACAHFGRAKSTIEQHRKTAWDRTGGGRLVRVRGQHVARMRYDLLYQQSVMGKKIPALCPSCKDPETGRPVMITCSGCGKGGIVLKPDLNQARLATRDFVELYGLKATPEETMDEASIQANTKDAMIAVAPRFSDDALTEMAGEFLAIVAKRKAASKG